LNRNDVHTTITSAAHNFSQPAAMNLIRVTALPDWHFKAGSACAGGGTWTRRKASAVGQAVI
jgi:hypothetical protein